MEKRAPVPPFPMATRHELEAWKGTQVNWLRQRSLFPNMSDRTTNWKWILQEKSPSVDVSKGDT